MTNTHTHARASIKCNSVQCNSVQCGSGGESQRTEDKEHENADAAKTDEEILGEMGEGVRGRAGQAAPAEI